MPDSTSLPTTRTGNDASNSHGPQHGSSIDRSTAPPRSTPPPTGGGLGPAGSGPEPDEQQPKRLLDLSFTGLLGGALAAVSAAALGARLGLAGTLLGAAIGSLVSAVGAAAYTHSLRRTRELIKARAVTTSRGERSVAVVGHDAGGVGATGSATAGSATDVGSVDLGSGAPGASDRRGGGVLEVDTRPAPRRLTARPGVVRRIAIMTAVLFAAVLVLITGIELGLGRALDGKPGTTVNQVVKKSQVQRPARTSTPTSQTPASPSTTSPTSTDPATSTQPPSSTTTSEPTQPTSTSEVPTSTGAPTTPDPTITDPASTDPGQVATSTTTAPPPATSSPEPTPEQNPATPTATAP